MIRHLCTALKRLRRYKLKELQTAVLTTTAKIVLKLQTRHDRLNFARGIIEKRVYTYSNLTYRKDLLVVLFIPFYSLC